MATIAEQVNAEFLRIQQARNDLRTKGVELGITTSAADLDDIAASFGNIVDRGNVNAQVKEGETYTIQPGYHRGGTVAGVSGGGSYELQEKTVTPTKSEQVVTSDDGYYGMSKVVVNPIPENYQDVSPVTATAPKVLVGSAFVDSTGKTVPGSMPNNGQLSKTLDATTGNQSYTTPEGYTSGGEIKIVLEEKSATPTKSAQTVTPTAGKVLSKVVVPAIPEEYQDVTPVTAGEAQVLTGYDIVDATGAVIPGSMPNNGVLSKTLDATAGNQSFIPPEGYTSGGEIKIVLEEKTATPTKSAQTFTPTKGKVLSKVSVNAIPAEYQDVTPVTAGAPQVLTGYDIVDASGAVVPGSMPNNGELSLTFDPLTQSAVTIPAGYSSGGAVTMTDDLLNALKSI